MSTGAETFAVDTHSPEETLSLGEFVAKALPSGVLALHGELGSGKTVFVKGLARGLGVGDDIPSPTFVIEQVYEAPSPEHDEGRVRLRHIDAYRLHSAEELASSGATTDGEGELIAVEWAGRVLAALPPERIDVGFEHTGERSRRITFRDPGSAHGRLFEELRRWRGS